MGDSGLEAGGCRFGRAAIELIPLPARYERLWERLGEGSIARRFRTANYHTRSSLPTTACDRRRLTSVLTPFANRRTPVFSTAPTRSEDQAERAPRLPYSLLTTYDLPTFGKITMPNTSLTTLTSVNVFSTNHELRTYAEF